MELRQLNYFVTVAEELNFRQAAKRLYMEQPPLSRQIRQLESELGVELFYRSKRGVTLTEAGKAFLDEAKLTLAQAERAAQAAQQAVAAKVQKLTIGFSICGFNQVLPQIIQTYRQLFPNVIVTLIEMSTQVQIQALLNDTIDVGFIHTPNTHPDILTLTLLSEPLVVALPLNHPLTNHKQIDLHLLKSEPFVLCPQYVKPELYSQIMDLCQQSGFQPNIVQEVSPPEVMLGFVESGMGISLVGASAQTRHKVGVIYRPLSTPTPVLEIAAAWRKGAASLLLEHFLDVVKQA